MKQPHQSTFTVHCSTSHPATTAKMLTMCTPPGIGQEAGAHICAQYVSHLLDNHLMSNGKHVHGSADDIFR